MLNNFLFVGIIFITTNLDDEIDPAILSRAQVHIKFSALAEPQRARVWQNFVERLPENLGTLSPSAVAQLARWKINGREIKNILNMSVSLCRKRNTQLSLEFVENLIPVICPTARKESSAVNAVEVGNGARMKKDSAIDDMLLLDV